MLTFNDHAHAQVETDAWHRHRAVESGNSFTSIIQGDGLRHNVTVRNVNRTKVPDRENCRSNSHYVIVVKKSLRGKQRNVRTGKPVC